MLGESVELHVIPGVSSVSALAGKAWDLLGRRGSLSPTMAGHSRLVPLIRDHAKVFSILGKPADAAELAQKLVDFEMPEVKLSVGERLSYADEKLRSAQQKTYAASGTIR